MKFYKYLDRKYIESFWEMGVIRVGTLSDFRRTEEFGAEIGDKEEGISTASSAPLAASVEYGGRVEFGGGQSERIEIRSISISPDSFIYCVTDINSIECRDRLGYDAGFEIVNVVEFGNTIERKLREQHPYISSLAIGACNYRNCDERWSDAIDVPPMLNKASRFSYQREHRLIWCAPTMTVKLSPIIIEVPEARDYCRPIGY